MESHRCNTTYGRPRERRNGTQLQLYWPNLKRAKWDYARCESRGAKGHHYHTLIAEVVPPFLAGIMASVVQGILQLSYRMLRQ